MLALSLCLLGLLSLPVAQCRSLIDLPSTKSTILNSRHLFKIPQKSLQSATRDLVVATTGGKTAGSKEIIAQLMGYCVTVGSFTLKVPQIQKIISANSAEVIRCVRMICKL
jgi:hypothetical protein